MRIIDGGGGVRGGTPASFQQGFEVEGGEIDGGFAFVARIIGNEEAIAAKEHAGVAGVAAARQREDEIGRAHV